MSAKKQYGKGLSGFMLGLLLATAVIAAILFFLNKSNKSAFKEEAPKELPKPEMLTPKSSEPAASAPVIQASGEASGVIGDASDVLGGFIEEQQASEAQTVITETPPAAQTKPQEAKPKSGRKAEAAKPARKKEQQQKDEKPSPEQILDSGSIEKAREENAKKKAERRQEARKAQASAGEEGGRTVLQMGSFNNRESAEAHRAKIAMMGVSSNVVEAEAGGKPVYRVQSGRMSGDAARSTQQTLKQNGIESFVRTVK